MKPNWIGSSMRVLGAGTVTAAAAYATVAGVAWYRYGRTSELATDQQDELLDSFMPRYDVIERHQIDVDAPAAMNKPTTP